jgi:hypothetical protein
MMRRGVPRVLLLLLRRGVPRVLLLRLGVTPLLAPGRLAPVVRLLAPSAAAAAPATAPQKLAEGAAPRERGAQQAQRLPRPRRALQQRVLTLTNDPAGKREHEAVRIQPNFW